MRTNRLILTAWTAVMLISRPSFAAERSLDGRVEESGRRMSPPEAAQAINGFLDGSARDEIDLRDAVASIADMRGLQAETAFNSIRGQVDRLYPSVDALAKADGGVLALLTEPTIRNGLRENQQTDLTAAVERRSVAARASGVTFSLDEHRRALGLGIVDPGAIAASEPAREAALAPAPSHLADPGPLARQIAGKMELHESADLGGVKATVFNGNIADVSAHAIFISGDNIRKAVASKGAVTDIRKVYANPGRVEVTESGTEHWKYLAYSTAFGQTRPEVFKSVLMAMLAVNGADSMVFAALDVMRPYSNHGDLTAEESAKVMLGAMRVAAKIARAQGKRAPQETAIAIYNNEAVYNGFRQVLKDGSYVVDGEPAGDHFPTDAEIERYVSKLLAPAAKTVADAPVVAKPVVAVERAAVEPADKPEARPAGGTLDEILRPSPPAPSSARIVKADDFPFDNVLAPIDYYQENYSGTVQDEIGTMLWLSGMTGGRSVTTVWNSYQRITVKYSGAGIDEQVKAVMADWTSGKGTESVRPVEKDYRGRPKDAPIWLPQIVSDHSEQILLAWNLAGRSNVPVMTRFGDFKITVKPHEDPTPIIRELEALAGLPPSAAKTARAGSSAAGGGLWDGFLRLVGIR